MKLVLNISGKNKTFETGAIYMSALLKAADIAEKTDHSSEDINIQEMNRLIEFAVDVFKNQFTKEEFMDGIQAKDSMNVLYNIHNSIMVGVYDILEDITVPNAALLLFQKMKHQENMRLVEKQTAEVVSLTS